MNTVSIGGVEVEIYDSIDELPIARFHKYNKMLLIDAGIGSDLADFDRHAAKVAQYLKAGDTASAAKEVANMRQNVHMVQQGLSPRHLAFAALVKSVDGEPCDDISDDGLRRTCGRLSALPVGETAAVSGRAKKKIDMELRTYFPKLFDDAAAKEYHDKLARRSVALLRQMRGVEGAREQAETLGAELLVFFSPEEFAGCAGAEVRHDRQFEDLCIVMAQNLNVRPKAMTVVEYYSAVERLKEEARRNRKELESFRRRR